MPREEDSGEAKDADERSDVESTAKGEETAPATQKTPQFEFRFSGQVTAPAVAPRRNNDDDAKEGDSGDEGAEDEHDPYFEPLVFLPLVDIITCEEGAQ